MRLRCIYIWQPILVIVLKQKRPDVPASDFTIIRKRDMNPSGV